MRGRIVLALIAAAFALGAPVLAAGAATPAFPKPTGYVNDLAHLLDPSARAALERRLAEYDRVTGNQIAVAIFPDLGGVPINEFAVRLEEAWKVGRRGKDNGILLLVGVRERQVRIEVGYGLEGRVTDSDAGMIIRNVIAPAFRAGRYGEGVDAAVGELIRLSGGGGSPSAGVRVPRAARPIRLGWGLLPTLLFLVFVMLSSVFTVRSGMPRCPRCRTRLVLQRGPGVSSVHRIDLWVCPQCGYSEKVLRQRSAAWVPAPMWLGGGAGWGTGGFSGGGFGG
ncbi:MAG TPA: TPM domain-containing protein, partial [bacterium]|nr:TPM domain-containing protein [bacterium]